jgi:ABC-type nitrate/sulfonate/bicarbonate transport system permease component
MTVFRLRLATPLRRGLVSLGALALAYGLVAQVAGGFLPRRIWMTVHYIEDVELLPPYRSLAEELVFLVRSGILQGSVAISTGRVLQGLALGAAVGMPLGLAMARVARLEYLMDPWVTLFRFTPALALLPLYVLWFGFGEASKVLLIATGVAVVTLLGAYQGARDVPRVYLEAAVSLGASRWMVLRRVILPAALPQILSAIRIAVGLAWVTIVVAELIDARMPSLGYLLALAGAYPRVPTIMPISAIRPGAGLRRGSPPLPGGHRWMRRRGVDA